MQCYFSDANPSIRHKIQLINENLVQINSKRNEERKVFNNVFCGYSFKIYNVFTIKPVLNGHPKIDKTKLLMTNGSFMKVESIAECSPCSILQYF